MLQHIMKGKLAKAAVLAMVAGLTACTGGSGAPTETESELVTSEASYSGPAPQTAEIQNFKSFFWDPITGEGAHGDKCSSCHSAGGAGPTKFADRSDVNFAFNQANTVVNLADPANSLVVQRVASGHNCWSADLNFCRDEMIRYIEGWRDGAAASLTVVSLTAPAIQDPSSSKAFPADATDYQNTIWPLVTDPNTGNCLECHSDTAPLQTRQTPYFASADVNVAYEAAKSKIDLNDPAESRLVVRLRDEFHNCWTDCASDADTMRSAVEAFVDPLPVVDVDPDLVVSKALNLLDDGIAAASGGRVENNIIALYEFKAGTGNTVIDRSGVPPSADLQLSGVEGVDYDWLGAWGIQLRDGRAQATVADSKKIHDLISATGEYSLEAWVAPANVTQEGPAKIVSYSASDTLRNFTLGQTLYNYDYLNRSDAPGMDQNGEPMLSTPDAAEVLQATLQHVVVTYDPINGRQVYVNGQLHASDTPPGAALSSWNDSYALVLGAEVSGADQWQGAYRLVAIHSRALSQASVQSNFDAGVGQKFFLLFSISHLMNTPQSYIVFEVSQFDNYSYLFADPFYISLDPNEVPETFDIQGMRIGINGKLASVGQGYVTLDTQIDAPLYDPVTGQSVSNIGTIIPLENGSGFDQFFLVFDRLGTHTNVIVEADPPDPTFAGSGVSVADMALRNFAEINASFAAITGLTPYAPFPSGADNAYSKIIQQLPSVEDVNSFLASHQTGVTQLSIAYCTDLIGNPVARTALGVGLAEIESGSDDANSKSVAAWDAEFVDPMIAATLNTGLAVQPAAADVKDMLHHLLFTDADGIAEIDPVNNPVPHGLSRCGGGCAVGQTETAAITACSALLGSAGVTLQ